MLALEEREKDCNRAVGGIGCLVYYLIIRIIKRCVCMFNWVRVIGTWCKRAATKVG